MNTNKFSKFPKNGSVYLVQAIYTPEYWTTDKPEVACLGAKCCKTTFVGPLEEVKAKIASLVPDKLIFNGCASFFKEVMPSMFNPTKVECETRFPWYVSLSYRKVDKNICAGTITKVVDGQRIKIFPIEDREGIYSEVQRISDIPLLDEWQDIIIDELMERDDVFTWYDAVGFGCSRKMVEVDEIMLASCIESVILTRHNELSDVTRQVLAA